MDPDDVELIVPPGGFFPRMALLTVENTHNRGNGAAYTVEQMQPLVDVARANGMAVHMTARGYSTHRSPSVCRRPSWRRSRTR